ncbi:hypothetical protein [Bradyrhizobium sp.]|uniref:hypothetical protein n=1 Tax=Bradyrhizobium sp. TaxID=376 RepID=UPI0025C37B27|nr:hypothetical protein [Bradyrhizobium sp.]
MFLAFAYLFVGLVHTVSHANEAVAAIAANVESLSNVGSDDGGSKKSPVVAEHCHICAPMLMPPFARVAAPSAHVLKTASAEPNFLVEDHPRLDTPPPKHLT